VQRHQFSQLLDKGAFEEHAATLKDLRPRGGGRRYHVGRPAFNGDQDAPDERVAFARSG